MTTAGELLETRFALPSVCFMIAALFYALYWRKKQSKDLPPGPTGLPLLGYLPYLGEYPHSTLMKLSEKYGPMYSINIGGKKFIVLNSYDLVHEALVNKSSVFSGREWKELLDRFGASDGMIHSDCGPKWKTHRKFGMSTLKGFGVGKRSMEDRVREEIRYLSEVIGSKQGEAFDVHEDLSNAVANIICSIVNGHRFEYTDDSFRKLLFLLNQRFCNPKYMRQISLMQYFPYLRHIPPFKKAFDILCQQITYTRDMFYKITEDHISSLDHNNIRDFIDAYLKETENKTDHFTRKTLNVYIRDLFNAGTETTTTTLLWCLLYLAKHPELQDALAAEIKTVSGENGQISMTDRRRMPRICSYIHEVQRHRQLIPLVPRMTKDEVLFRGYRIPKDSLILVNLWAIQNDPKTFDKPEELRPERFIDKDGRFFKHDHVIPFSIGPRTCLGMNLAEMELFSFLTGILRNFRFVEDPQFPLPPFDKGGSGLVFAPLPFKLLFVIR